MTGICMKQWSALEKQALNSILINVLLRPNCCSFFGNLYTPEGVKPDPKKVDAIKQMQPPMNKQQLSSFLGMVPYLSQYMPNISSLTAALRGLLKKDALFQWSEAHDVAFQRIKNQTSEDVCLRYFDTTKEVVLQVDASQVGLGVVLLQDGKPVAYASKALTAAEMRYANIEREMLVVVFGCLKYHHYLYGRRFVCRSDHQPLEKIHLKNLSDALPRLQRLLLKIQPYDFEIKYIPWKEVALADALSRVNPLDKMELKGLDFSIHELTPCMTLIQVSMIHEEQKKDATMQLLIQQLIQGWPNNHNDIDPALNKYWALRDDISIEDGCIAYLGRLIIPPSLRKTCMESLYRGHPVMSKMYLRTKQFILARDK